MLRSLKAILGYRIEALDVEFGRARDFFFDDRSWGIRHLVVYTGDWLLDNHVLISSEAVGEPNWDKAAIPVALTKEQVENSPGIESHLPVSRRREWRLADFFAWRPYWTVSPPFGVQGPGISPPALLDLVGVDEDEPAPEPHLQSVRDLAGYRIQAADGEAGRVADFLAQTDGWGIRYLVVETRKWLPGRKVLISPAWVTGMDGPERLLRVALKREEILSSAKFDPSAPVNRESEVQLYDYYGRPRRREAAIAPVETWNREDRRTVAGRRWKAPGRARQARPSRMREHEHVG
jgi:hypothetical protein